MDNQPNQRLNQRRYSKSQASCFETTHWSAVLLAAEQDSSKAEQALAELCNAYWMPIYALAGKSSEFSQLKSFVTVGNDAGRISEVAENLGISAGAARVAVHRLRRRYRQVLRDHVAATVDDPTEIDDEIRSLFAAFD